MRRVVMVVLVVSVIGVGLVVLRGRCDDGKGLVEFPYVVRIAPQNVLFVDGHEFHGEVVCTWEPGDSLRIEGIPVLPRRSAAPSLDEELLQGLFGGVPYVQSLVKEGVAWRDAVDGYNRRIDEVTEGAQRAYWKALEATGSEELALNAALDSLDRSLLDTSEEIKASASGMSFKLQGQRGRFSFFFGHKPPWEVPTLEEIQRVTREKASDFIRRVARHVGETRTACLEIPTAGRTVFGRDVVRRALRQIEEAEKGNVVEGPLLERELKLILMVRGVKVDGMDD